MIEKYQNELLQQADRTHFDSPIRQRVKAAFMSTPRHNFVKRYRNWATHEWKEVTAENLEQHLGTLYADRPLILAGDDDDDVRSTISQPSFVLRMLDLLDLSDGQAVFELGSGSGWNAALLSRLVGADGRVYSMEILPDLAQMAAAVIESSGIKNVHVITGDGGDGYPPGAPYDRIVFTAGAYDLPRCFYSQIKDGGLLLAVIKNSGGGDNLFLLRKNGTHFESLHSMPCGFVQFTGKYKIDRLDPMPLDSLPGWPELQRQEVSRMPFWWGGKGKEQFVWRTHGVRSFLAITEPRFRAFKSPRTAEHPREEQYFGLFDPECGSLTIAKDDLLITYGTGDARQQLLEDLRSWVDLGMPSAASFGLWIYPANEQVTSGDRQWLVSRNESQFLWTLS